MPIDLKAVQNQREKELSDFITRIPGQAVDTGTKTRALLNTSREKAFANLPSIAGNLGIDPMSISSAIAEQSAFRKGNLARTADANIAKNTLSASSDSIQKKYEQNLRIALQSGQSLEEAVSTARQTAMDEMQRQQQALMNAKNRQFAIEREDAAQGYTNRGLEMEAAFQPRNDYQAALSRALFGLAGAGLTAYGMNKYYGGGQTYKNPNTGLTYGQESTPYGPTPAGGQYPINPWTYQSGVTGR